MVEKFLSFSLEIIECYKKINKWCISIIWWFLSFIALHFYEIRNWIIYSLLTLNSNNNAFWSCPWISMQYLLLFHWHGKCWQICWHILPSLIYELQNTKNTQWQKMICLLKMLIVSQIMGSVIYLWPKCLFYLPNNFFWITFLIASLTSLFRRL